MGGLPTTTLTGCQEIISLVPGWCQGGGASLVGKQRTWCSSTLLCPLPYFLCLRHNFNVIPSFIMYATTNQSQQHRCCLRRNVSPTTCLTGSQSQSGCFPSNADCNAFPRLPHSSSEELLNKSSPPYNCIWENQREGHLAHSAPPRTTSVPPQ